MMGESSQQNLLPWKEARALVPCSPGVKMNRAFHWEEPPGTCEIQSSPEGRGNDSFLSTTRPEHSPAPVSVHVPPESRNEVGGPTTSPVAPHPAAAAVPFHLHESHFPNDPWPHVSLKEALLSAGTHSTCLSSSQGAFISSVPLLPRPPIPSRGIQLCMLHEMRTTGRASTNC